MSTSIQPLFENIIHDNPTYPFPMDIIKFELLQLYLHQEEYYYFTKECVRILNLNHHEVFSIIFITQLDLILDTKTIDPYDLPQEEYERLIDEFISSLENINITRILKDSPDGEIISNLN